MVGSLSLDRVAASREQRFRGSNPLPATVKISRQDCRLFLCKRYINYTDERSKLFYTARQAL